MWAARSTLSLLIGTPVTGTKREFGDVVSVVLYVACRYQREHKGKYEFLVSAV
jgi:hypothetical protein